MFTQTNQLILGSGLAGQTANLRGQLVNTAGASVGGVISTGFVELTGGMYLHTYTSPDTTEVAIKYYLVGETDILAVAPSDNASAGTLADALLSLLGSGRVSVSSPVTAGGKVTVYSGYAMDGDLRITFTEPDGSVWPDDLTGATVHLLLRTGTGTAAVTADITGTVVTPTGTSKVVRFAPTAVQTAPLVATTTGRYDLYATISTVDYPLVVGGKLVVLDRVPV